MSRLLSTRTSRTLVRIHDGLWLLLISAVLLLGMPKTAFAYVDPSVMTYTIQALAGVAVALSAVIGVAFRRSRRALMHILHIDENAKKDVEPNVFRIDPDAPDADLQFAKADNQARFAKETPGKTGSSQELKWTSRFMRSVVACLFLVATLFVVAPLEVIGKSNFGLLFGFYDILALVLVSGLITTLVLALLVSAIRGRIFDITIAVIVAIGLCSYIQAMFLNNGLPVADGGSLDLNKFSSITTISSIVWVAIIAVAVVLACVKVKIDRVATLVISIVLIIVQTAGVVSIATDQRVLDQLHTEKVAATREGLYTLSEKENVVVFVLDTYDQRYLNEVLETDPHALSEFTGFTCFTNSVGSMVPTRYAMPFLVTGRTPEPGDDFRDFVSTWVKDSTFLPDIQDAGFTTGIYTDSLGTDIVHVAPYAMNIHEMPPPPFEPFDMAVTLDKVALYRDMPWILKPLFWFTTDDLNRTFSDKGDVANLPYTVDDFRFGKGLRDRRLAFNDEDKSFRLIHMLGPHKPYTIDEDGRFSREPTTRLQQARGSLKMVAEYLQQMKDMGAYDDATIIVTADHGNWQNAPEGLTEPTSIILLVKPPETPEEASEPIKFSGVPTGHVDYAATVIDAVGGDASKYGETVFDIPEKDRPRYYWHTTTDYHNDTDWTQFVIDGDVLDYDSWDKTGNVIEIPHRN